MSDALTDYRDLIARLTKARRGQSLSGDRALMGEAALALEELLTVPPAPETLDAPTLAVWDPKAAPCPPEYVTALTLAVEPALMRMFAAIEAGQLYVDAARPFVTAVLTQMGVVVETPPSSPPPLATVPPVPADDPPANPLPADDPGTPPPSKTTKAKGKS